FLAEREVAAARDAGLPTTIYRPAIVVGDHRTGKTQKFDGPYFLINWLLRQPKLAAIPSVSGSSMARFNVVPCDFIIDAIDHLSGLEVSLNRPYQLCAPNPLTVDEPLDATAQAVDRRLLHVPFSPALAATLLERVPP